jgi:Protein of unknown function (DUF3293)
MSLEDSVEPVSAATVAAYQDAVYEVELPRGLVVLTVGTTVMGDLGSLTGVVLAVVTAHNPGTRRPGDDWNARANARLEQRLVELGHTFWPAVGRSRDGSHAEASFAVPGISREVAAALGREFDQACVFYWERRQGELLWCSEGSARVPGD